MPSPNIHIVVGTLLVTTFTSVGLLGLWAGASKWHWFLRCLVVVAVFLPLALIPAYEVLLLLLVQVLVTAAGTKAYFVCKDVRRHARNPTGQVGQPLSYHLRWSMTDLLLGTLLAATLAFAYVRMSRTELYHDWLNYLLTGSMVGGLILASAWIVSSQARLAIRLLVILVLYAMASATVAYFNDWPEFFINIFQQEAFLNWIPIDLADWTLLWVPIMLGIILLVCGALWLLRKSRGFPLLCCETSRQAIDRPPNRRFAACLLVLLLLIVTFPAITCWTLLTPPEMLQVTPPEPNGYDSLAAAGKLFNSQILNHVVEPTSMAQLAAEVERYAAAYRAVQRGLSYDFENPKWYSQASLEDVTDASFDASSSFRRITRAVNMKCELARRQQRFDEAATNALWNIRLGLKIANHGVLTEYLTGIVLEDIGRRDLFRVVGKLEPHHYQKLVEELIQVESNRVPLDTIMERELIWMANKFRWQGHLMLFLQTIAGGYPGLYDISLPRHLAKSRLLITELTLHAYRAEHGKFPTRLTELVPDFLPRMFADPFSSREEPFIYRRTEAGYLLYSLGPNRQDDGGIGQAYMAGSYTDWNTGDLRLKLLYAE